MISTAKEEVSKASLSGNYDKTLEMVSVLSSDLLTKLISFGIIALRKLSAVNNLVVREFMGNAFASLLEVSTKYSSRSLGRIVDSTTDYCLRDTSA